MKCNTNENHSISKSATYLQHILNISRLSHYINSMIRDLQGSFRSVAECEEYLNKWVSRYICRDKEEMIGISKIAIINEVKIKVSEKQQFDGKYIIEIQLIPSCREQEFPSIISRDTKIQLPRPIIDDVDPDLD